MIHFDPDFLDIYVDMVKQTIGEDISVILTENSISITYKWDVPRGTETSVWLNGTCYLKHINDGVHPMIQFEFYQSLFSMDQDEEFYSFEF